MEQHNDVKDKMNEEEMVVDGWDIMGFFCLLGMLVAFIKSFQSQTITEALIYAFYILVCFYILIFKVAEAKKKNGKKM